MKQLVAKGVMSPYQAHLLSDTRRHLREWRRTLVAISEKRIRLTTNNVDTSNEHAEMVRKLIAQNEALVANFDPEGLTADGNIEIGDVGPQGSSVLIPGRWVAYSLNEQGHAVDLRLYEAESPARTDAGMAAGRQVGVIANDMWSISPPGE